MEKNLTNLAKTILEKEYDAMHQFFMDIIDTCVKLEKQNAKYVMITTQRRSNTLFWIFWNILQADESLKEYDQEMLQHIVHEHVITDVNAMNTKGLADRMTKVIVVSDLLIHGRELNSLLLKMQNNASAGFENKTDIFVYAVNNCTMLLHSKYQNCLKNIKTYNGKEWRMFLKRVASLISVSGIHNTYDSWGMQFADKDNFFVPPTQDTIGNFVNIKTDLQYLRQDNYIWMYPDNNAPKAMCSVRIVRSYAEGEYGKNLMLAIPSVIMGKTSLKSVMNLNGIFRETFCGSSFAKLLESEDRMYEVNNLILDYMLFNIFVKSLPEPVNAKCVNLTRLSENFSDVCAENGECIEIALSELLNQDFTEDFFRKCMDTATADTEPLYSGTQTLPFEQCFCNTSVIYTVENVTAEMGIEAEKSAHHRCHSAVSFSFESLALWGTKYSITDMFRMCSEAKDMQQTAAVILQELDLGILNFDINTSVDKSSIRQREINGDNQYFYLNVRA